MPPHAEGQDFNRDASEECGVGALMIEMEVRPVEVLLVEDNPGDVRLATEGLREGEILSQLSVVPDGQEANVFLHRQGRYADARRPDVIILDLNLPRMSGREVLAAIKSDHDLRRIPVVVLSASGNDGDVASSYELGANCYVIKPSGFEAFVHAVKAIEEFRCGVARLPSS